MTAKMSKWKRKNCTHLNDDTHPKWWVSSRARTPLKGILRRIEFEIFHNDGAHQREIFQTNIRPHEAHNKQKIGKLQ